MSLKSLNIFSPSNGCIEKIKLYHSCNVMAESGLRAYAKMDGRKSANLPTSIYLDGKFAIFGPCIIAICGHHYFLPT
jgi:hypothetical protein